MCLTIGTSARGWLELVEIEV
eukprot:COSAG01_NODE_66300_length_270_cov_1.216374_1_plen_20_part_01